MPMPMKKVDGSFSPYSTLCVFAARAFFLLSSFHLIRFIQFVLLFALICAIRKRWCVCVCAFLLTQSKVALCGVGMSLILLFVCSEVSVHSG